MSDFKLDTSGTIWVKHWPTEGMDQCFGWENLSPFVQGYVEALFAEWRTKPWPKCPACDGAGFVMASRLPYTPPDRLECSCPKRPRGYGFRHLAPETLARIIEDCEQAKAEPCFHLMEAEEAGRKCWKWRQVQILADLNLWPLTVALNNAGKVVFQ